MEQRVHAEKATLPSGFLFHFVKEKGYTQGTEVNKGHCSWAAINSLPFFICTEIEANGNLNALSVWLQTNIWHGLSHFLFR